MRIFGLQLFHHRIQPGGGDVTGTVAKTFGIESFNAENDLEYMKADHVKCLRRIASHLLTFAIHTPLSSLTYSWAAEASRLQGRRRRAQECHRRGVQQPALSLSEIRQGKYVGEGAARVEMIPEQIQ